MYAGKQGTPGGVEGLEADEMDFEEDRFADDEEHDDLFNEDEEAKAAEKRIKQDQLKANVFDLKNEKDYEEEEIREKREKEARRVLGKKVRKALQKREKNYDYSSGSDVNPYSDEEVISSSFPRILCAFVRYLGRSDILDRARTKVKLNGRRRRKRAKLRRIRARKNPQKATLLHQVAHDTPIRPKKALPQHLGSG